MDIYCPICAEPWDNDSLHDVADENKRIAPAPHTVGAMVAPVPTTYAGVATDFRKRGCKALESAFGPQSHCKPTPRAATAAAIYELMGDDMDGAAVMFDDAGVHDLL